MYGSVIVRGTAYLHVCVSAVHGQGMGPSPSDVLLMYDNLSLLVADQRLCFTFAQGCEVIFVMTSI